MKILVIQTAFIGDVVLSTSILNAIRSHPDQPLTDVLLRKGNENLLKGFPGIRNLIVWDKKERKYAALLKLLKAIRQEKYDAVVNLQRFGATGFLTAFSGAAIRIGYDKNPFSPFFSHRVKHFIGKNGNLHETKRNDALLEPLGIKGGKNPCLFPSEDDYAKIRQWNGSMYYCIAPTSVWFTKQVPASKWLELIKKIVSKDKEALIYLLGGPDDRQVCQSIAQDADNDRVKVLAGELSLLQTAALMKNSQMNYVNDSAPLHLASAMNAPVRAFFCSTIPEFGFGALSENSAIREVKGLSCRPCGIHGHKSCPEKHFRCALELDMRPD